MIFKTIFHLDGTGIYYDPWEPIHLDALICRFIAPRQGIHDHPGRDDIPTPVDLPLKRCDIGDHWIWCASALLPEGPEGEDLQFWRCRFRSNRADLTAGSPNLTNGTYRDWNMPMPLRLYLRLVAYANGSRKEVRRALRDVRYLGKKYAHGHGRVVGVELVEVAEDWSLVRDGRAMRWLPAPDGVRMVRLRPPYWNNTDRVRCCEVGAPWTPHTPKEIL